MPSLKVREKLLSSFLLPFEMCPMLICLRSTAAEAVGCDAKLCCFRLRPAAIVNLVPECQIPFFADFSFLRS